MARLFLSTDDNAPVVAGADSTCLVNLLKKCLIEGYGGKAPVGGWTMPHALADGSAAVFRNDHEHGGLGHYLRVGKNPADTQARNQAVQAFENMTGVDDGVFPYTEKPSGFSSSATNNNVARPWIVLASKRWMALFIYLNGAAFATVEDAGNNAYGTEGFWFGDIEKWNPGDNYHSMLACVWARSSGTGFGNTASASSSASTSTYGGGNNYFYHNHYRFPRKSDGVGGEPVSHFCFAPHPQSGEVFGARGPAYSAASGLLVARAAINDGQEHSLRGWIPEMLVPLHTRPFANLERVEANGKNHVAVCFTGGAPTGASNCGQALFELDAGE